MSSKKTTGFDLCADRPCFRDHYTRFSGKDRWNALCGNPGNEGYGVKREADSPLYVWDVGLCGDLLFPLPENSEKRILGEYPIMAEAIIQSDPKFPLFSNDNIYCHK